MSTHDKDIKERYLKFLKNGDYTDCCFLVGTPDTKRLIRAHKLVLAMGSPVFERMLFGELSSPQNDPIEVTDVEPEMFDLMLEYIYVHQTIIYNFDDACLLGYTAEKYMISSLFKLCRNFIVEDLEVSNICRAYEFAKLLNKPKFMAKCMEVIAQNTSFILLEPSFVDIETSTLMDILDQKKLAVKECDLFKALLNYLRNASNSDDGTKLAIFTKSKADDEVNPKLINTQFKEETIIRQAVKKIRFLTMTPQEFADGVTNSNLLTSEEALSILLKLTSPYNKDLELPDGFSSSKQNRFKVHHCNCNCLMWNNCCLCVMKYGFEEDDVKEEDEV